MCRKLIRIGSRLKKLLLLVFISSIVLVIWGHDKYLIKRSKPQAQVSQNATESLPTCPSVSSNNNADDINRIVGSSKTRRVILMFVRGGKLSSLSKNVIILLESSRFKFSLRYTNVDKLPALTDNWKINKDILPQEECREGRFSLVIFEDISIYLELSPEDKARLDKYCKDFDVGILTFHLPPSYEDPDGATYEELPGFGLKYVSKKQLGDCQLNPSSPVLRIARPSGVIPGILPNKYTVYEVAKDALKHYQPISYASEINKESSVNLDFESLNKAFNNKIKYVRNYFDGDGSAKPEGSSSARFVTSFLDKGLIDGVKKVVFGGGLKFWMNKVLMLDAISYLSRYKLTLPLERYVQIDIDDIFVGAPGKRMTVEDVDALATFQVNMRKKIPGFKFFLGFSGAMTFRGTDAENAGDAHFLEHNGNFSWFPHMFRHQQAHQVDSAEVLCSTMEDNKRFADKHGLDVSGRYSVAPHHSGVYPVHDPLYDCWRKVWDITSTSTEEYPHLNPSHKHRGFIHKGISVLPRQTCGLYTHTIMLDQYPNGGPAFLHDRIYGGSIFQSILYNRINIFMTHLSNYGGDRLALYTFQREFDFVNCWTNLILVQEPPAKLAEDYFAAYPEEKEPIWLNPCLDKRHKEIWSESKDCTRLPKFVIVGPQKTGTTALHWYLTMHPDIEASKRNPTTFEEVQFFNSPTNYAKGLEWYLDFFPTPKDGTVLFEKSAGYFDSSAARLRLSSLIPDILIVIVLIDPADRAHSWYQHMKSKNLPAATQHSFDEVVRLEKSKSIDSKTWNLHYRCLEPGMYASHIERWLEYIDPDQMIIIDGEIVKSDPVAVMSDLQHRLHLKNIVDYKEIIKLDEIKGYFCQTLENNKRKCLGPSKGRKYDAMEASTREYLNKHYGKSNHRLRRILEDMEIPVHPHHQMPSWLQRVQ